jgi:F-box/WD-40 domain protein 7
VFDIATGQTVSTLEGHTSGVWCCIDVHERIWSGSDDATIRVWHPDTASLVKTLKGHAACVTDLQLIGDLVYSTSVDRSIGVWSAVTFSQLQSVKKHTGYIAGVVPLGWQASQRMWTYSNDRTMRLWSALRPMLLGIVGGRYRHNRLSSWTLKVPRNLWGIASEWEQGGVLGST